MPFCKICYDAGIPNYNTHAIKFYNFQKCQLEITCPYLKNITCASCGEKGHTASYCKANLFKAYSQKSLIQKDESSDSFDKLKSKTSFTTSNLSKPKNYKNSSNGVGKNNLYSNMFHLLYQDDNQDDGFNQDDSFNKVDNLEFISFTSDGEILGRVSDIIWGYGIVNNLNLKWIDNIH